MNRERDDFSAGKVPVDIDPYLAIIDDENYRHEFSNFVHASKSVSQGLHNQQMGAHLNQYFHESAFLGKGVEEGVDFAMEENRSIAFGVTSDYNCTDSPTPSSSVSLAYSETIDCLSSNSFPSQAESLRPLCSPNVKEHHSVKANSMFRRILPRPAEHKSIDPNTNSLLSPTAKRPDRKPKKRPNGLAKHTKSCHKRPFNCDLCRMSFGTARDLKRHRMSHSSSAEVTYRCIVCKTPIRNRKDNIKRHFKEIHDIFENESQFITVE
jgi:hypothetical protein